LAAAHIQYRDGDRVDWLQIAAVVAFNAVGIFSFGVEPVLASELQRQLGLPPDRVGILLAVEFGGSMLATIPALLWSRRVPARTVALTTAGAFIVANAVCIHYQSYPSLLLSRALAGLAAGTLVILTLTVAARTAQPARTYGLWVIGQTLLAALGLLFFPQLSARFGIGTLYGLMAGGMLAVLPLAQAFDAVTAPVTKRPGSRGLTQLPAGRIRSSVAILLVLFLFYMAAAGLWAFAGERGRELSLSPTVVGPCLATAYLLSIGGAGMASRIGAMDRSRLLLTVIGHVALAMAAVLFAVKGGLTVFIAFAVVLQLAWAFTAPLLLAAAAAIEPAGWLMAPANFILSAGLSAGPLLAGPLIERPDGAREVAWVSMALLTSSLAALRIFGKSRFS
jgi:predicted MFS family arabinose efflux permease